MKGTQNSRKISVPLVTLTDASALASFRVVKTKSEPLVLPRNTSVNSGLFCFFWFVTSHFIDFHTTIDNWISHFVHLVDNMCLPYGYRDKLIDSVIMEKVNLNDIDEKYLSSIGIKELGLRKRIVNDLKSLTSLGFDTSLNNNNNNNNNNNSNAIVDEIKNERMNDTFKNKNTLKKAEYDNKQLEDWSNADVIKWLYINSFQDYIDSFISNSIDGEALMLVDDKQLKDMGVAALGHRKKILKMIKTINQTTPRNNPKNANFALL